jgi:hypothetical protein
LGLIQGTFPGLPLLTIVLQKFSGLSTFQVGLVLMGIMRVLSVVSLFLLGENIFQSSRVGAAAALVYTMNANFLFFSSQFSYESLAVPLLLVTLLILQYLLKGYQDRTGTAWSIVVILNISAIIITHHLATYMMIAIFILMAVLTKFLPRFTQLKSPRQLFDITLFSIIASIGWLYFSHSNVVEYLGDPISRGIEQIATLTIRRLFLGISLPWYEIISGYASAILIALLSLFGALVILRNSKVAYAAQVGLLAFGLLYIFTAPLVLTAWGAESGRRSWVYSFISLALLSGCALAWLVRSALIGNHPRGEVMARTGTTLALALLLMGGVATSTSISYRFPGEYLQNSDARSFTPELIDAAQWLLDQAGPNNRILGDRTTERIFGSYGLQEPAMYGGPKPWEVFFPISWTPGALLWLEKANAPFVVVDKRMAEMPPQMDFRFQRDEPSNNYVDRPLPRSSVEKFDELPRSDRIYDSGNIRIYYLKNTVQGFFSSGNGTVSPLDQNHVDSNLSPVNLFDSILILLMGLFRSTLLIPFFLIVSGYIVGQLLFPDWSILGMATRVTLAISISISLIIVSTTILALVVSNVGKATLIVIFILRLLMIIGFTWLLAFISNHQPAKFFSLAKRVFSIKVWQQHSAWIFVIGFISILFVIFLMWQIKPRYDPRTDLAFNLSSVTPRVQITNRETGEKTYQIMIYSINTSARIKEQIVLAKDQSIQVDLESLIPYLPSQDRIYLDLYIEGQEKPYRSLHFILDELPKESQLILEQQQRN